MKFRIEKFRGMYVLYQQFYMGWKVVGRYRTERAAEVAMSLRSSL